MSLCAISLAFASLIVFVKCENILMIAGMPSPSHHIWNRALIHGLAENPNLNITFLSIDIETKKPPNVHYIHLEKIYEHFYGDENSSANFNMTDVIMADNSAMTELSTYSDFCNIVCSAVFKTNGMKTILNYPDNFKFDLVIHDYTCGPCLLFLMKKFNNPPLVSVTAFANPDYTLDLVGGHKHCSYIPFYGLNYGSNMNIFQRTWNCIIHGISFLHRNYQMIPNQDSIVRQNIKWDFPYLGTIEKQTVLALVSTHPAVDLPEPLSPNVIPVGGLQITEPKPVPDDLEKFINGAKKGAVLFSLGTNVKSDQLGPAAQIKILNALEQMPDYHFLWKFETDTLPMKPAKNVLVRPWMPQNDLLGHPKIKLFITHSGGLSTTEASWYGVPLVAIPFMVDQHRNTFKSLTSGVAVKIDFLTFTTEDFKKSVLTVLENPSYRNNMKLRSARFRDQKEKPLDRAVWWINWVLRNPNPDHIQSPTMKLGFIRSNSYDIIAVFVLLTIFVIYILSRFVSLLTHRKIDKVKMN